MVISQLKMHYVNFYQFPCSDGGGEPQPQPIGILYPTMVDCKDDIVLIYDLFTESNGFKIKDLVLKKEVKTIGDFCNLPLSCFGPPDQSDIKTIKKTLDEYFERKSVAKSSPVTEIDCVELETPLPIKSSDDSKSSDDVRTLDSYPNGQIIEGNVTVIHCA